MKLYIPQMFENEISQLQKEVMEKEIDLLSKESVIDEGHLDLKKVYVIENDEGAEAQVYIRNNTGLTLKLEGLPMHLTYNESVIGIVCPDFKGLREIPPKTIAPFKIQFNHENIYYPEFVNEAEVRIGVEMNIEETVNHKVDNLPNTLNYEQKKFIEDFCTSLKDLRADTYDFNVMTLSKNEDRTLNVAILIRNGYDHDIEVETIPLVLYNGKGLPMYEGSFRTKGLIVKAKSASAHNLVVPASFIPISEVNYEEFIVEFRTHGQ